MFLTCETGAVTSEHFVFILVYEHSSLIFDSMTGTEGDSKSGDEKKDSSPNDEKSLDDKKTTDKEDTYIKKPIDKSSTKNTDFQVF